MRSGSRRRAISMRGVQRYAAPETLPYQRRPKARSATAMTITSDGAEVAAGDYPNAVIQVGMAKYVDDELVSETLTLPIHLVVG